MFPFSRNGSLQRQASLRHRRTGQERATATELRTTENAACGLGLIMGTKTWNRHLSKKKLVMSAERINKGGHELYVVALTKLLRFVKG